METKDNRHKPVNDETTGYPGEAALLTRFLLRWVDGHALPYTVPLTAEQERMLQALWDALHSTDEAETIIPLWVELMTALLEHGAPAGMMAAYLPLRMLEDNGSFRPALLCSGTLARLKYMVCVVANMWAHSQRHLYGDDILAYVFFLQFYHLYMRLHTSLEPLNWRS